MTQKFKGDLTELMFEAAGAKAFDLTSTSLDQFFDSAYVTSDFLLMLYDAGRMPFSDRVPRESFVAFITQALPMAQVTGTFEAYIFTIKSIFGQESEILFDVPAPGKIDITVNSAASLTFEAQGREFGDGVFTFFGMQTSDGYLIEFRGIAGIDSEAELLQLLSELIPAGIYPTVTLEVFTISQFIAQDSGANLDSVTDAAGNQLVFFEH